MSKVYRHKFTPETIEKISYFAKLHMHDDRHVFKDAWKRWVEVNNETITNEINEVISTDKKDEIELADELNNSRKKRRRSSANIE